MSIAEIIKPLLVQRGIPYKENQHNLIIRCPVCYFRDGKDKLKLYIHKESGVFHCFRCNSKGNLVKLTKLLNKYYQIDLIQFISIDDIFKTTFNTKYLSQLLTSIDTNTIHSFIQQIRKNNPTLQQIITSTSIEDKKIIGRVYGYLLKRNIPISLLHHLPYFIGTNVNSPLFCRFGVCSFFYTNYEARTILPNHAPRYLQSPYRSKYNEVDFIFLPHLTHTLQPQINQKELYTTPNIYQDKKVSIEKMYVVEGVFDALKLNLFLNLPVISLGGWGKYKNVLLFLKSISQLFKEFKVGRVVFLFDKDVGESDVCKIADTINCYKSYMPFIENFEFRKFGVSDRYKDVGDVRSPEELRYLLKIVEEEG